MYNRRMSSADYHSSVRRVLIGVLLINASVTATKFVVGALSGSIAVLADAFNSLIDSVSNVIGLLAVRAAADPPDADHPYGHRRYETLATLSIGALLLLTGWEVLRNVFERLAAGGAPQAQPLSLALLALTVPVNLFVVWYEGRRGRALRSDVLLADATQTRVNLWTTGLAFAGLSGGSLGLPWLDIVLALGITAVIGREAWRILRDTAGVLSDSAAVDPARVEQVARRVPGVRLAARVRSRGRDDDVHLDLHIKVDAAMSTSQAHAIASEVERRLKSELPGVVDAVVHVEPGLRPAPTRWEATAVQVRAIADGLGLGVHNLHMHPGREGYTLDVDVEVDASLSLEASHAQVSAFENRVRAALPDVVEIATHIEPVYSAGAEEVAQDAEADRVRAQIVAVSDRVSGQGATHHVTLRRSDNRYDASLHVVASGQASVVEAHLLAEAVERRLREEIDHLDRVTVHVEPPEG
jgi:cation diffusion facilitator family transporter